MTDAPAFMQRPGEESRQEVLPFSNNRRIESEVALARDKQLQELSIDTRRILEDAAAIYKLLLDGHETVVDHLGEQMEIPLTRERIAALNSAKDICFKLLAKTMPDIKQIVMRNETGDERPFSFEMLIQEIVKD